MSNSAVNCFCLYAVDDKVAHSGYQMTIGIDIYIVLYDLSYLPMNCVPKDNTLVANCSFNVSYLSGLSQALTLDASPD